MEGADGFEEYDIPSVESVEQTVMETIVNQTLYLALKELPERERMVVYHSYDGTSNAEIAKLVGCSLPEVGRIRERALKALRRKPSINRLRTTDEARGKLDTWHLDCDVRKYIDEDPHSGLGGLIDEAAERW